MDTSRGAAVTGTIACASGAEQVDGLIDDMDFRLSDSEIGGIEAALPKSLPMMELS